MVLTDFETEFFDIDLKSKKERESSKPKLIDLFYKLSQKVNNDCEIRKWTVGALRNYVDAFYWYTEPQRIAHNINSFTSNDNNLKVFYTGLKTGKYHKLFIVYDKKSSDQEWYISTEEDYICTDEGKVFLNDIKTSEDLNEEDGTSEIDVQSIQGQIISDLPDFMQRKKFNGWIHIILDGIDNFPQCFIEQVFGKHPDVDVNNINVRQHLFFDALYNDEEALMRYQDLIFGKIQESAIQTKNKYGGFPCSFYKNLSRGYRYNKDNKDNKDNNIVRERYTCCPRFSI